MSFAEFFWPGDSTIIHDPALHIDTHDDIAMSAIQTSLAVLVAGSSLASKLPFIAPIAGLLLQAPPCGMHVFYTFPPTIF
jgi:hypothetical protein